MPAFHGTPESLLPRSDSKNPASTCRGLTSTGRPCRRAIARSPQQDVIDKAFARDHFCWQHQDQAPQAPRARSTPPRCSTIGERRSIDSLAERLGIVTIDEVGSKPRDVHPRRPAAACPASQDCRRSSRAPPVDADKYKRHRTTRPRAKPPTLLRLLCCGIDISDSPRQAPRPVQRHDQAALKPKPAQYARVDKPSSQVMTEVRPTRPSLSRDVSSRTGRLLALIPSTTSPQITAQLLAELSKPVSVFDEPGYIYIYWLTPEKAPRPNRSQLNMHSMTSPARPKLASQLAPENLHRKDRGDSNDTILLKIGRAQNVHRRLSQWSKQCGHELSLLRYYPPAETAAHVKIPCVQKVERLIHLELSDQRAKHAGKCAACGREHREWYEVVGGGRDGVQMVNEVVKRWVDWSFQAMCDT